MYVSFFCGSIKVLVGVSFYPSEYESRKVDKNGKASVTHQKTAEQLSNGISVVCDDVSSCVKLLKVIDVESMRKRLAEIYLQVFDFFQHAMKWYKGNKFLPSLDSNLPKEFDSKIKKIRDAVASLHRDGIIGGHAEVRDIRLTGETNQAIISQVLKVSIETQKASIETQQWCQGYDEKYRKLENIIERLLLGRTMSNSLLDSFQSARKELPALAERSSSRGDVGSMYLADGPSRFEEINTRLQVVSMLKSLQGFIAMATVVVTLRSPFPSFADGLLIHSLQQWLSAEESQNLWIVGPPDICTPSGMATVASRIIDTVQASEIPVPVVFHFCKRPSFDDEVFPTQTQEEAAMVWLVYSLITQLVGFLAPEIDRRMDLSQERLSRLDGTTASWSTSLEILEELLLFAPALLFCIIDGLNRFDLAKGSKMCKEFLRTLRNSQRIAGRNGKVLKILLTTSGLSDALVDEIPNSERHFAKVDMETANYRRENLMSLSF